MWVWDCIFFYEFVEFTIEKKNVNLVFMNKGENQDKDEIHISRLNFLDYICLSMILDLKRDIINSDSSIILSKFLKFPNEKNMKSIMKEAFKLSGALNGGIDKWDNDIIKKSKNLMD